VVKILACDAANRLINVSILRDILGRKALDLLAGIRATEYEERHVSTAVL
jgi:hypothetical protein